MGKFNKKLYLFDGLCLKLTTRLTHNLSTYLVIEIHF
jgi:hypothetical protein